MRGNELPFQKICDELGCCLTTCTFLYDFGRADGLELAASGLLCRLSALNPNLARSWRDDVTGIAKMGYALTAASCLNS